LVRTLTFLQTQSENFKAFAIDRDIILRTQRTREREKKKPKAPQRTAHNSMRSWLGTKTYLIPEEKGVPGSWTWATETEET
jgi:hypothetical protein